MRIFRRRDPRTGGFSKNWFLSYTRGGRTVVETTGCADRKAAELVARRRERELADPAHAAADAATVRSAIAVTLAHVEGLVSRGKRSRATLGMHREKLGHIARLLGPDTRLSALSGPEGARLVDRYLATRTEEGAAPGTLHKELVSLRVLFKLAKRRGEYPGDISQVLPVGFSPEYVPRDRVLTRDEFHKLLEHTEDLELAAALGWLVATGCRTSELRSQLRADVDLTRGFIRIRGTKTEGSARTIPILAPFRVLVERALRYGRGIQGRLFSSLPWLPIHVGRICARAKIPHASPNDLRRTTASWLVEAGVPPHLVAQLLGHVDSRMVERVYGAGGMRGPALKIQLDALLAGVAPVLHVGTRGVDAVESVGIASPSFSGHGSSGLVLTGEQGRQRARQQREKRRIAARRRAARVARVSQGLGREAYLPDLLTYPGERALWAEVLGEVRP